MKNNRGITLVSLVITIIVMLILAGVSLSMVVGDNSVLKQASKATISKKLSEIKEEFQVEGLGSSITSYVKRTKRELDEACVMGDDLEKYIPGIDDVYKEKIAIFNGELVFLKAGATEEELQIAQELGYIMMDDADYYYMYNMYQLEAALLEYYKTGGVLGTSLGAVGGTIQIAGIVYGETWYKISATDLVALGFSVDDASTAEGKFGSYAPFVARFYSGEVLSQIGKEMYKDTPKRTHKYTFNYVGESDGIIIADLLAGVDRTSIRTGTQFGAFSAANGTFSFDTADHNALKLEGGAIGELGLDQNVHINEEYTINITVKCNVNQSGETAAGSFPAGVSAKHHRSMIAISDDANEYVCWIGVDDGILRAYNFRCIMSHSGWSTTPSGYIWADVSSYDNKIMNIQLTAKKGGEAKLYINGELKASGAAGNYEYTYRTLTIGDLRNGRNLKFQGKMYNVGIYGRALTEAEVVKNYNAIKKDLGF